MELPKKGLIDKMRLIDLDSDYIQETLYRRAFKTRQDIEEWLNNAPTIDAVPVVRCYECKHWKKDVEGCTEFVGRCDYANYMIGANGYCLYGEREENG